MHAFFCGKKKGLFVESTEFSFGIIPIKRFGDAWKVLLIRHREGHWGFPKGHQEASEASQQTATRELQEETGVTIKHFFSADPLDEHYVFFRQEESVQKSVLYFLAEVEGEVNIQKEEIMDFRWCTPHEAEKHATFAETKNLCRKVESFLKEQL